MEQVDGEQRHGAADEAATRWVEPKRKPSKKERRVLKRLSKKERKQRKRLRKESKRKSASVAKDAAPTALPAGRPAAKRPRRDRYFSADPHQALPLHQQALHVPAEHHLSSSADDDGGGGGGDGKDSDSDSEEDEPKRMAEAAVLRERLSACPSDAKAWHRLITLERPLAATLRASRAFHARRVALLDDALAHCPDSAALHLERLASLFSPAARSPPLPPLRAVASALRRSGDAAAPRAALAALEAALAAARAEEQAGWWQLAGAAVEFAVDRAAAAKAAGVDATDAVACERLFARFWDDPAAACVGDGGAGWAAWAAKRPALPPATDLRVAVLTANLEAAEHPEASEEAPRATSAATVPPREERQAPAPAPAEEETEETAYSQLLQRVREGRERKRRAADAQAADVEAAALQYDAAADDESIMELVQAKGRNQHAASRLPFEHVLPFLPLRADASLQADLLRSLLCSLGASFPFRVRDGSATPHGHAAAHQSPPSRDLDAELDAELREPLLLGALAPVRFCCGVLDDPVARTKLRQALYRAVAAAPACEDLACAVPLFHAALALRSGGRLDSLAGAREAASHLLDAHAEPRGGALRRTALAIAARLEPGREAEHLLALAGAGHDTPGERAADAVLVGAGDARQRGETLETLWAAALIAARRGEALPVAAFAETLVVPPTEAAVRKRLRALCTIELKALQSAAGHDAGAPFCHFASAVAALALFQLATSGPKEALVPLASADAALDKWWRLHSREPAGWSPAAAAAWKRVLAVRVELLRAAMASGGKPWLQKPLLEAHEAAFPRFAAEPLFVEPYLRLARGLPEAIFEPARRRIVAACSKQPGSGVAHLELQLRLLELRMDSAFAQRASMAGSEADAASRCFFLPGAAALPMPQRALDATRRKFAATSSCVKRLGDALRAALEAFPAAPTLHWRYARFLLCCGRWREALRHATDLAAQGGPPTRCRWLWRDLLVALRPFSRADRDAGEAFEAAALCLLGRSRQDTSSGLESG